MTRRINAAGLALIKQFEGLQLKAYRDVAGVLTIGYGSTGSHIKPGMTITETQAETLLMNDLSRFEERVDRLVKVSLNDNQFAALVSFDFNTGALDKSTLLKKLNKGDYAAVPSELMKWVNAGGKKISGLVNRRAAEAGLWAKGSFVSSNYVEASTKAPSKDVAVVAATGAAGAGTSVVPVLPDIVNSISGQQSEFSSGDWVRIAVAVIIVSLTLYGIYRKVRS